jgi:hypothetical protein
MRHLFVLASLALAACSGQGATEEQEPGGKVASEPTITPEKGASATTTPTVADAPAQGDIAASPTEAPFANLGSKPVSVGAINSAREADLTTFEDSAGSTVEVVKAHYSAVWAEERKAFRAIEEAAR